MGYLSTSKDNCFPLNCDCGRKAFPDIAMVQWKMTLLVGNPFPAPMIMGGSISSKQCSFGDFFIKIRPPCFGCVNGASKCKMS